MPFLRLEEDISDLQKHNDGLEREMLDKNKTIEDLTRRLEIENQARKDDTSTWQYTQNTSKIKDDLIRVEIEKQDALTRLRALMPVKLLANNPNIADLSDQFRPTKLAEMFSELYDNEWTDAFTAVSKGLTERQTVTFLLDIVMKAYSFCTKEMDQTRIVMSELYLTYARKDAVVKMTDEQSKRYQTYLQSICGVSTLLDMLSTEVVAKYVTQCVKLCLLMCQYDPPVVISCQDVIEEACVDLNKSDGANAPSGIVSNEKPITLGSTGAKFQNNLDEQATEEESKNKEQARGAVNIQTEKEQPLCGETNTEGNQTSGAMREIENESGAQHNPKRLPFDRDVFEEYISGGPYLEYVVWPVMFLHQGGPMLGKGVAHGTREAIGRLDDEHLTWKTAE
ncbi:uncharacterized protein LOC127836417 isoform X3 [Dreissena polymorpha]|uniref:uncharacterized protein LOC127836417 isoform X3 n=1 Tax=Dreissena polymorpha TaxID=45954 RepID=UPI0022650190|nr:uncharacterized protein LOC127836417 isoform X3 [Dreissena polymorpha]XP_052219004.1 uncharacterized protein LOC127836417 isoform X3 [Dreissena polymorpha]XP_052219005.1 uncharacterized protein LOC127836417 isoform X3 [Dreissena polymorpha]XP_052219006.1 uncharacterized protein LOC127836417 isoform X3 [Dreissena polymorpha]XP_052219007.1 uncharacterized protein LOC127836417 isoform X3 [Dreissena polymorpha]